jgi:hypothetical protein
MLGQYVFTAAMTIGPERDALLNEVYDTEHVPEILKGVPGMISISRYRRTRPAERFYLATYEIATPDIPPGPHFMKARDIGRWPTVVRPHTSGLRNGTWAWRTGFGGEGATRVATPYLLFAQVLPAVADNPDRDATLLQTLDSVAAVPGVTNGAHYVDVGNGTNLLVAGFSAEAADAVVERVSAVTDPEVYAALGSRP